MKQITQFIGLIFLITASITNGSGYISSYPYFQPPACKKLPSVESVSAVFEPAQKRGYAPHADGPVIWIWTWIKKALSSIDTFLSGEDVSPTNSPTSSTQQQAQSPEYTQPMYNPNAPPLSSSPVLTSNHSCARMPSNADLEASVTYYEKHVSNKLYIETRKKALNELFGRGQPIIALRTFQINSAFQAAVEKRGCDVAHFAQPGGNVLQLVLHSEIVDIINTSVTYANDTLYKASDIPEVTIDFACLAHEYNQAAHIIHAQKVIDFCWGLLDCMQAAVEGIADGAWDAVTGTYHFFRHPLNSIAQTGKTACFLAQIISYTQAANDIDFYINTNQWQTYSGLQEEQSRIVLQFWEHFKQQKQQMQLRDYVKAATNIATNWVLTNRLNNCINNLCGKAINSALNSIAPVEKAAAQAPILDVVSTSIIMLEKTAIELGADLSKIQKALEEFPNFIPIGEHMADLERYAATAASRCIHPIGVNLHHQFMGEIIAKNNRIGGLHHDHMGFLEKIGMIRRVETFKNGMYEAEIFYNNKWHAKTFFPEYWTRYQVIDEEINFYNINYMKGQQQGTYRVIREFLNGIRTKLIIKDSKIMQSFFPYVKQD